MRWLNGEGHSPVLAKVQFPASTQWLTTAWNSSSRDQCLLLASLDQAMHGASTYIWQTFTYKKINLGMYMEYSDDGILSSNKGSMHIFHVFP